MAKDSDSDSDDSADYDDFELKPRRGSSALTVMAPAPPGSAGKSPGAAAFKKRRTVCMSQAEVEDDARSGALEVGRRTSVASTGRRARARESDARERGSERHTARVDGEAEALVAIREGVCDRVVRTVGL